MPSLPATRVTRPTFRLNLPPPGEDNAVFAEDDEEQTPIENRVNIQRTKALPPTPPPSYRSYSYGSTSNAETREEAARESSTVVHRGNAPQLIHESTVNNEPASRVNIETTFQAPTPAKERLLVELRAAPITDFDEAVPLKNFSEFLEFYHQNPP